MIGCAGRNFVILESLSAFLGHFSCSTLLWDGECVSTFTWRVPFWLFDFLLEICYNRYD